MTAGKSRVCSLGMFSLGIGLAAVLLAPREAFALQPLRTSSGPRERGTSTRANRQPWSRSATTRQARHG